MTDPKHAVTRPIRSGDRVSVDDLGGETVNLSRFLLPGPESTSAELRETKAQLLARVRDLDLANAEVASAGLEIARLRRELDGMITNRNVLSRDLDALRRELDAAHTAASAAHQRVVELAAELLAEQGRAATGDRSASVVAVTDAWQCLTRGGCAKRFDRLPAEHYCGRLTPIRIAIVRRTEGVPPQ